MASDFTFNRRQMLTLVALFFMPSIVAEICTSSTCTYSLAVDIARTMTFQGNDVFLKGTQLVTNGGRDVVSPDDVIVADGFPRTVITINGRFPGPTIEVNVGTTVVVRVTNNLRQRSITVHWHGILQRNTYFMDGAAYVTQCPIPPMQSFVYRFVAEPIGTHWYHAHMATIRVDGLYGLFIVHDPAEENRLPYFPVTVSDWYHETSETMELQNGELCENGAQGAAVRQATTEDCTIEGSQVDPRGYVSSLFDGSGRYKGDELPFPLKQYVVTSGQSYRFRLVNVGSQFSYQISIDGGHQMWIVASDGAPIQPLLVDSFFIFVGESIDFEVVADRPPGRYWIRANTPCGERFGFGVNAILAYVGYDTTTEDPTSTPTPCTSDHPCRVFNCPFDRYPTGSSSTCITMADARTTLAADFLSSQFGIGKKVDEVHFLNFAMNVGSSVNSRRFRFPSTPMFQQVDARGFSPTLSDCVHRPCEDGCSCRCAQVLDLPLGKVIRLVITNLHPNTTIADDGYHTIHIHGYNFAVVTQRFPTYDPVSGLILSPNGDVTCRDDPLCVSPSWSSSNGPPLDDVIQPVVKDSLVLPTRGYQVLQFVTNNPGLFLMHCHVDMHMMEGMTIVLRVGAGKFPPLPPGFPTCNQLG